MGRLVLLLRLLDHPDPRWVLRVGSARDQDLRHVGLSDVAVQLAHNDSTLLRQRDVHEHISVRPRSR